MRSTLGARLRPRSRRSRALLAGLAATSLVAVAAATVEAAAPPVGQKALADRSSAPQAVIVVLRDQHGKTPAPGSARAARAAAVRADQAPLLDAMRAAGATHIKPYTLVNAFAATIPAASVAQLRAEPGRRVGAAGPHHRRAARPAAVAARRRLRRCAVRHRSERRRTPGRRDLPDRPEPAAGRARGAEDDPRRSPPTAPERPGPHHRRGREGRLHRRRHRPEQPRLHPARRLSTSIIDYQDFSGDGPTRRPAAPRPSATRRRSPRRAPSTYDLSDFVNPAYPLPAGCNIRILGVAPGASIVALKAGGEFLTELSSILQSIDYAVSVDHVDVHQRVVRPATSSPTTATATRSQLFNEQAVAAGVTVTVSHRRRAASPARSAATRTDPDVISVGAIDRQPALRADRLRRRAPFSNGKWVSDNISALSSSGFTKFGRTLDLVAPGEGNWAVVRAPAQLRELHQLPERAAADDIQSFGGTSESAPLTAGVAAW